jgi:iron(III) transport system substrate-binding protein
MQRYPTTVTRRILLQGAAVLALPLRAGRALAADAVDLAAAKQEGKVVLYTSAPIGAAQKVASAFQDKYGIKVELFRSGGTEILRRFMTEQDAGHKGADVLVTSDPAAAIDLAEKGTFVPFKPAGFEQVPESVRDAQGRYVAQRISLITNYGRTDLVPRAEFPKAWSDLTQPKWKGKLVMTDPSFTSLQLGVVAMISKLRGWEFYEALHKNEVLIVKGNEQALSLLKRGERVIAAGADSQYANEARLSGHPIESVFPEDGTFAIPAATAVVRGSNNPNAAKLMAEYLLGEEAQKLWPQSGIYAARSDIAPPAGAPPVSGVRILPMDYAYIQKVASSVKNRFNEIFS